MKLVVARDLVIGDSRSCGCLAAEPTAQRHLTHGESKTRRYRIWKGLLERCYNPNQKSYAHYGAKGVTRVSSSPSVIDAAGDLPCSEP